MASRRHLRLLLAAIADGVITGVGAIHGRPVCVFSQDVALFGGALGQVYGEKIVKVMDLAIKTGRPLIGINDGAYVIYLWWGLDPSGSLLNGDSFSDPPWGAPPGNTRPFSSSTVSMQAYLTADDTPYGNPVVFTEQEP